MSFDHNSKTAQTEPAWSDVDKTKLPDIAFADTEGRRFPHHWIQNGGEPDQDGRYSTGTMFLHRGGLKAAWAAAQGARSGQEASPAIKSHLQAHRQALGLSSSQPSSEAKGKAKHLHQQQLAPSPNEENAPMTEQRHRGHIGVLHLSHPRGGDRGGVDRRSYDATFITAGYVVQADGKPSNWLIPAQVIQEAAPLFDGVACYLDHPEIFGFGWRDEPQVKNLIGVTSDVRYNPVDKCLDGTITLYDTDPNSPGAFVGSLLDQMLADKAAGRNVPPVGLSAVFFQEAENDKDTGNRITRRFKKVESVDLVYSPGAGGYIKHALSTTKGQPLAAIRTNQKGTATMPEESPQYNTQESEGDRSGSAAPADHSIDIAALHKDLTLLEERLEALNAASHQDTSAIEDLREQVAHLTQALASQERPIQGLGQAPNDNRSDGRAMLPARFSIVDPLAEFQNAWDWIFGVESAATPLPELRRTDYLYRLLSGDLNWTGVFNEREALAAANTTTLADMAVNAMNKVIIPLYHRLAAYRWYEAVVAVQPTDGTLHDMAWLQFGGIGDLPVVAEGAAYTELTVGDTKETSAFVKYGGYVGLTDKLLRNSDIARIQAIPRALTISAVQTRSAKIAAIFTDNSGAGPTMAQDSVALFHTVSHGNLATTAFSWTAWKAARLECMKQTELTSSKRQALFPKFCLVPADLYDEALIVFGYGAGPGGQPGTANNDVNPYAQARMDDARPVPVMVPDWTDTNDWAYIADPVMAPIIQMAYADNPSGRGHPPPQLFTVTSPTAGLMFTNDVLPIKVRDYFAYGVATYRGIGKRNVT